MIKKIKPSKATKSINLKSNMKTGFKNNSVFNFTANTNIFYSEMLKMASLELAVLDHQTGLLQQLKKDGNTNAKILDGSLQKIVNGQEMSLTETRSLSSQMQMFLTDSAVHSKETNNLLNDLNLNILKIVNGSVDAELNGEKVTSALSRLSQKMDTTNITEEKVLAAINALSNKGGLGGINSTNSKPGASGGLLDTIKTSVGSALATALLLSKSALLTGAGKIPGVNRFIPAKYKTPPSVPVVPGRMPRSRVPAVYGFVDEASQASTFGSKFKKFGAASLKKAGKGIGRFIPYVGLALTVADILGNAKDEFFGKDSDKKTITEKLRNTATRSLSDLISAASFGFSDTLIGDENIKKGLDKIANTFIVMSSGLVKVVKPGIDLIGKALGEAASSIYDLIKPMLDSVQNWSSDFMKELQTNGLEAAIKKKIAAPINQASEDFKTNYAKPAINTAAAAFNHPIDFIKNAFTGGSPPPDIFASSGDNSMNTKGANRLASISENRYATNSSSNPTNKNYKSYQGKKFKVKDNVNSEKGYGSCLNNAALALDEYEPGFFANIGGTYTDNKGREVNANNAAAGFTYWARQSDYAKKRLYEVGGLDKSQNNYGLLPGDIVVYGKGENGHSAEYGHIEIIGTNGNANSDYTNPGSKDAKSAIDKGLLGKGVSVFRLKGGDKILGKKQEEAKSATPDKKAGGIPVPINVTSKNKSGTSSGMPGTTPNFAELTGGANVSASIATGSTTIKATSTGNKVSNTNNLLPDMKKKLFSGMYLNENQDIGTNPSAAYEIKHAGTSESNFSIGKSQFDLGKQRDAWKKLGYTEKELNTLTALGKKGKKNLNSAERKILAGLQGKLKGKEKIIDKLDLAEQDNLLNQYNTDKNVLFKNLDVSDPKVQAQMIDIYNQYGKKVFDKQTVQKLTKFSKGGPVTEENMNQWRQMNDNVLDTPEESHYNQKKRFEKVQTAMKGVGSKQVSTAGDLSRYALQKFKEQQQGGNFKGAETEKTVKINQVLNGNIPAMAPPASGGGSGGSSNIQIFTRVDDPDLYMLNCGLLK